MNNKGKRVVVGLSGGVDSSVTAYLLQKEGYEVIGLFMKNWHDESVTLEAECPWVEDATDALLVAQKLGIPYQNIDLSVEYKERIVDYMFAEYEKGRTPNPDVLCNREIKFDIFLKEALKLGADFVATGHYCRKGQIVKDGQTIYQLKTGLDKNKDQSYFLCQLTQEQLKHALFPIGNLQKSEVRKIAEQQGLITANKKDSQGLCFIGKVHLPDFLKQQLASKKGKIIEVDSDAAIYQNKIKKSTTLSKEDALRIDATPVEHRFGDGKVVGEHSGAHFFTIGQRKGIGVGGKKEPLFVIEKNTRNNLLFVGEGNQHPGLLRKTLKIEMTDIHWVREDLKIGIGETLNVTAQIRYRQPHQKAVIHQLDDGLFIEFEANQSGIASGQFAAWYIEDELVGSGTIS